MELKVRLFRDDPALKVQFRQQPLHFGHTTNQLHPGFFYNCSIIRTTEFNLSQRDPRKTAEAIEILEDCPGKSKEFIKLLENKYLTSEPDGKKSDIKSILKPLLKTPCDKWIILCALYAIAHESAH